MNHLNMTAVIIYIVLVAVAWAGVLAYSVRLWKTRMYKDEGFEIIGQGVITALGSALILLMLFAMALAPR